MNKGLKIVAALVGLTATCAMVEISTGTAFTTVQAQVCGCGNPSCGGCAADGTQDVLVSTVYGEPVEIGGYVEQGSPSCQKCQAAQAAPEVPCQYCELKTKKVEVEKSGFKIEQKEVCVPAVRYPWMKCNPPKRSRVRTVNVLKKHKSKGEKCEYKWSVHEPEDYDNDAEPTPASNGSDSKNSGGSASKSSAGSGSKRTSGGSGSRSGESYPDPSAETTGTLKLSDPAKAFGDVPRPPLEN